MGSSIYVKSSLSPRSRYNYIQVSKAKKKYTDFKFEKNDTLLFGRESAGVPEKIHKRVKYKLKIPMIKKKRSLNLATSVAISLSENLRQTNNI